MRIHRFAWVPNEEPFRRYAQHSDHFGRLCYIRIKEMRKFYPCFTRSGSVFTPLRFPAEESHWLGLIKSWSSLPGQPLKEKTRLNRANRRRVRQLIVAERFEADFRRERVDDRA